MRWPTCKDESDYLAIRQKQNRARFSKAEEWAAEQLEKSGLTWTRQALWGYRIFDFWNHAKGIAVEIDGYEHRTEYDAVRDEYNYQRSRILVFRVRNFDQVDMQKALDGIRDATSWKERRRALNRRTAPKAKSGKDKLKRPWF